MNEELEADLVDETRPVTAATDKKLYSNYHVVSLLAVLFSYIEVIFATKSFFHSTIHCLEAFFSAFFHSTIHCLIAREIVTSERDAFVDLIFMRNILVL